MIHRRGRNFGVAVYDPATRRMRWVGTYETEAEAANAETLEKERGETIASFSRRWLTVAPRPTENSNQKMHQRIQPFATRFGELRLGDLASSETRAAVRAWAAAQPNNVFEVTRLFINDAIRYSVYRGRNPLAEVRASRRLPASPVSDEQLLLLADAAIDTLGGYGVAMFAPLILATAHLQLAVREICALRADDVHADHIVLREKHQLVRIALNHGGCVALQLVERQSESAWFFTAKQGGQLNDCRIHYYWQQVRAAASMPTLQFNALRWFWPSTGRVVREYIG